MTEQTIRNALVYLGVAILPPIADAVYQALASQMAGGKPIDWGQLGLVAFLALLGAIVTAMRPRVGHEAIAAQVDYLQATSGMAKREMVVLHQDEAAPVLAGAFSPTQLQQVTDALELRLRLTPAVSDPGRLSKPPRFLDDAEHQPSRDVVTGTPPLPPEGRG